MLLPTAQIRAPHAGPFCSISAVIALSKPGRVQRACPEVRGGGGDRPADPQPDQEVISREIDLFCVSARLAAVTYVPNLASCPTRPRWGMSHTRDQASAQAWRCPPWLAWTGQTNVAARTLGSRSAVAAPPVVSYSRTARAIITARFGEGARIGPCACGALPGACPIPLGSLHYIHTLVASDACTPNRARPSINLPYVLARDGRPRLTHSPSTRPQLLHARRQQSPLETTLSRGHSVSPVMHLPTIHLPSALPFPGFVSRAPKR